jgi:hypothetical protein
VHGEGGEVKKNVVSRQSLIHNIVTINGHNGHTQEEMKVVRLIVGPACFPYPKSILFFEFTFEAQQYPPIRKKNVSSR